MTDGKIFFISRILFLNLKIDSKVIRDSVSFRFLISQRCSFPQCNCVSYDFFFSRQSLTSRSTIVAVRIICELFCSSDFVMTSIVCVTVVKTIIYFLCHMRRQYHFRLKDDATDETAKEIMLRDKATVIVKMKCKLFKNCVFDAILATELEENVSE